MRRRHVASTTRAGLSLPQRWPRRCGGSSSLRCAGSWGPGNPYRYSRRSSCRSWNGRLRHAQTPAQAQARRARPVLGVTLPSRPITCLVRNGRRKWHTTARRTTPLASRHAPHPMRHQAQRPPARTRPLLPLRPQRRPRPPKATARRSPAPHRTPMAHPRRSASRPGCSRNRCRKSPTIFASRDIRPLPWRTSPFIRTARSTWNW